MSHGFLIDMDGVVYGGEKLIPGAKEFIQGLVTRELPFLFMTNNSQRSRRDVVTRLRRMGIEIQEKHVFTSAIATARFIARQKSDATAYVLGEGGLLNSLHEEGVSLVQQEPDYVVVGEGRNFTLEMVDHAVNLILDGAKLIATNRDPSPRIKGWTNLGIAAVVSMIEEATGVSAFTIGKPNPIMFRAARKELGLRSAETTIVGDTMDTDILGGVQMGYRTILVLTGVSQESDLKRYAFRPDRIVSSVAELDLDDLVGES